MKLWQLPIQAMRRREKISRFIFSTALTVFDLPLYSRLILPALIDPINK